MNKYLRLNSLMSYSIQLVFLSLFISSCSQISFEKRRYSKGIYVDWISKPTDINTKSNAKREHINNNEIILLNNSELPNTIANDFTNIRKEESYNLPKKVIKGQSEKTKHSRVYSSLNASSIISTKRSIKTQTIRLSNNNWITDGYLNYWTIGGALFILISLILFIAGVSSLPYFLAGVILSLFGIIFHNFYRVDPNIAKAPSTPTQSSAPAPVNKSLESARPVQEPIKKEMEEVLYLKNGSIIHGNVIETIPGESIKIQTHDGNLFVFKMTEVLKVTKEEKK